MKRRETSQLFIMAVMGSRESFKKKKKKNQEKEMLHDFGNLPMKQYQRRYKGGDITLKEF